MASMLLKYNTDGAFLLVVVSKKNLLKFLTDFIPYYFLHIALLFFCQHFQLLFICYFISESHYFVKNIYFCNKQSTPLSWLS